MRCNFFTIIALHGYTDAEQYNVTYYVKNSNQCSTPSPHQHHTPTSLSHLHQHTPPPISTTNIYLQKNQSSKGMKRAFKHSRI